MTQSPYPNDQVTASACYGIHNGCNHLKPTNDVYFVENSV